MAGVRCRGPPATGAGQPPLVKLLRPVAAFGADVRGSPVPQQAPHALVELSVAGRRRVQLGGGGAGAAEAQQLASASIDAPGTSTAEEGPLAAVRAFFLPRQGCFRLPNNLTPLRRLMSRAPPRRHLCMAAHFLLPAQPPCAAGAGRTR